MSKQEGGKPKITDEQKFAALNKPENVQDAIKFIRKSKYSLRCLYSRFTNFLVVWIRIQGQKDRHGYFWESHQTIGGPYISLGEVR